MLIEPCLFGGKESGETLTGSLSEVKLDAQLEWTFPLSRAVVVSGDGKQVYRKRIDLSDTQQFGSLKLSEMVDLRDRAWVRLEVWDIAANGAFTQPVWIE